MRNVKVLWGMISILLVALGVLSSVFMTRLYQQNEADVHSNPEPPSKAEQERAIASIGEHVITRQDLQQQLLQKYGKEVLDQMIDREVVRREAGAIGVSADEPEIKRELERMQQGYESESQFYQAMEEQLGLSREALNEDVRYKLLMEKVAIQGIQVADVAVDEYIQHHPEEFQATVQLRLEQIVTASKEQANRASADLAKGMDFAKVAKERSLDDATRNSGGDLGWLEEDDPFVHPQILKAGKQLQPGQVSKPIEVDGSYVIVRLRERKVQSKGSPESIREQVRRELALREAPPMKETMAKLRVKWNVQIRETDLVASG
ncbi:foldase protein PrsA [Paenibacillus sp. UNCCL117]|uniref:peptidylprolyl isomerase n=1 Tax=unclassified Paenibacillus TaxID=185978 RepID=UPI00088F2489|nr:MULTISPECIES: peptidylprolyl isomerase [unclassified Paenibacillus]SDE54417.1 foldase protein PrsA [Paenibacillus sp. cl123]SFW68205.1 foldase protein PrsA [Paenibacillus sp. UNCCL117]